MDSIDPGSYLSTLGTRAAPVAASAPSGDMDAAIMGLLRQTAPAQDTDPSAAQNARIAQSVTPTGANRAMTWLRNAPAAAGGELTRLGMGLTGQKMDPLMQSVFDASKNASPGMAPATDVLATAPLAMGIGEAVPALGARAAYPWMRALMSGAARNPVAMGALQGAAQGAATADPGQRLMGGAIGGVTGGVLPAVTGAVGKLATGLTRSPEAQFLIDQGINVPPGMLNQHGAGNAFEQAAMHVPVIGSKIANARLAVPAQVTERMVQDAAAPGATLTPGAGSDINGAVSELKNGFENAYTSTLGTKGTGFPMAPVIMNTSGPNVALADAFRSVASSPRLGLDAGVRAKLGAQLQSQLNETLAVAKRSGGLEATDLQGLRSAIRDAGRDVSPIDNASRAQKAFWGAAEQKVTDTLTSQLPAQTSAALSQIDQQYGKYATVRALAVAAKDRTPTINDWSNAIAHSTPPNVYAAGGGWNRDLINAAAKVVKPTVAHTGALGAGTIAPAIAALEAATHPAFIAAHPLGFGVGAGALGALYGGYTGPGMRALAGQTAPQQAIQGLLGGLNPTLKQAASLAGRSAILQGLLGPSVQAGAQ